VAILGGFLEMQIGGNHGRSAGAALVSQCAALMATWRWLTSRFLLSSGKKEAAGDIHYVNTPHPRSGDRRPAPAGVVSGQGLNAPLSNRPAARYYLIGLDPNQAGSRSVVEFEVRNAACGRW